MPALLEYAILLGTEFDQLNRVRLKLIETYHWTPEQIDTQITIAQFLGLWLYQEQEDDGSNFRRIQAQRQAELAAKNKL